MQGEEKGKTIDRIQIPLRSVKSLNQLTILFKDGNSMLFIGPLEISVAKQKREREV